MRKRRFAATAWDVQMQSTDIRQTKEQPQWWAPVGASEVYLVFRHTSYLASQVHGAPTMLVIVSHHV
jgi:hypothetical protein